jgi:hypothetical protein
MKSFTQGHVNITALRTDSPLEIAHIIEVLEAHMYPGDPPSRGFGGVAMSEQEIEAGFGVFRASPGPAKTYTQEGQSDVLLTRYLFDRHRFPGAGLPQQLIEDMEAELVFELNGIDVLWLADSNFILLSSHDPVEVQQIIKPAVDEVLQEAGHDLGSTRPHPRNVPEPDLFLWLLYRLHSNPQLDQSMRLSMIRTMNHQDGASQNTRMLDSVAFDRSVLLTAIAEPGSVFGPAKLAVYDAQLGLSVDFYLDGEGQVSAHVLKSEYLNEADEGLRRSEFGIRLARDVSTVIIPKLLAAHGADNGWTPESRQDFVDWARGELNQRIEGMP